MPDPFTREELDQTVWQRCRRVLNAAMAETPGNFEQIARTVYAYVLRERADVARLVPDSRR